jgi:hypothetical protein
VSRSLSIQHLKDLLSAGKIRGFNSPAKVKEKAPARPSKQVQWMHWQISAWCMSKGYTLETEYRFHPDRRWRFDFYIKELNCGIEYEGIFSEHSRHTNKKGYTGDTDKYTKAAVMGIKVLRYTSINYKNVLQDLQNITP